LTEHKDVMIATLGTSSGIAGLTLVFLGLVIASLQGFAPGTAPEVIAPFRRPAATVLLAFAASILSTLFAALWLVRLDDVHWLYVAAVWTFFIQLVLLAIAVVHVLVKIVWS